PGRQLGRPVSAKAVMPSLRGNPGTTLTQMGQQFLPGWPWIQVRATANFGDAGRSLDPTHFHVGADNNLRDAHVLGLEDTWVTGGHSKALAVALKRAGAAIVTVLPICLLLNPAWGANATFSQSPHRRLWSPDICPVTGSDCP